LGNSAPAEADAASRRRSTFNLADAAIEGAHRPSNTRWFGSSSKKQLLEAAKAQTRQSLAMKEGVGDDARKLRSESRHSGAARRSRLAAQDRYTLQVPGGLAFSEFRGYEDWQIIAASHNGDKIAATASLSPTAFFTAYPKR